MAIPLILTTVTWATNFENILNNYPNVFMTLNGHDISDGGTAYNKKVGNREECFFNMQGSSQSNRCGDRANLHFQHE